MLAYRYIFIYISNPQVINSCCEPMTTLAKLPALGKGTFWDSVLGGIGNFQNPIPMSFKN